MNVIKELLYEGHLLEYVKDKGIASNNDRAPKVRVNQVFERRTPAGNSRNQRLKYTRSAHKRPLQVCYIEEKSKLLFSGEEDNITFSKTDV